MIEKGSATYSLCKRAGRGRRRAGASLLIAGALSAGAVTAAAQTNVPRTESALPGSQFQGGDGDQADATAAGLIDWQGLQYGERVGHTVDPQAHDDVFASGKELAPGEWRLTTQSGGASPASENILDVYRTFEHPDGAHAFLYLAFTREARSGTSFVAFDLNQDHRCRIAGAPCGTWRNPQGYVIPCRTTGDILVLFSKSGNAASVQVARWTTVTEDGPTECALTGKLTAAGNLRPPPAADANVQGAFNPCATNPCNTPQDRIQNFLPGFFNTAPAGQPPAGTIGAEQFGEAALDLTSVLGNLGGACDFVFGSTWMHSRSSVSENAELKDLVAPQPFRVRPCRATPALTTSASGAVRTRGPHRLRRHRDLSGALTIYDTAVLSDGDDPTGTLTFRLYGPGDASCSRPPVFTYESTVRGNGSYRSGSFTPVQVGTYRWVATYSGDDFNEPAATRCGEDTETITIHRPQPTLTTTASGPTQLRRIAVGPRRTRIARVHTARATEPISDAAQLAGGFRPTGTITFRLHGPGDPACTGTPLFTSQVAVSGNGTYHSEPFTPRRAGTYRWVVSYSGDANNLPAGPTDCGDPAETIAVARARPALVTVASPTTEVGEPISDRALLTGGANPRGRIAFRLYGPDDDDCSGPPAHTSRVRVRGNGIYTAGPFSPTEPGTYRWVATYTGDRNNVRTATSCSDPGEEVRVGPPPPVQPALSTTAAPAAAPAGTLIRDTALLADGAEPVAGTITFELFGPDDPACAGAPAFIASVRVAGNGAYTSPAFRPTAVGTYRWVATYSGDERNHSAGPTACADPAETVTVSPAQARIRTVAQPAALIGHGVRDGAVLSGASRPTGSITFRLYGPDDPTCSNTPVFEVEQQVAGRNGFYPSPRFEAPAPGRYLWTAAYGGDANNLAAATSCGDPLETSVVLPRQPRLATSASPRAYLSRGRRVQGAGRSIYDSARLTRTFRAAGQITFTLYGPGDETCSGPPVFTSVTAVTGNGIYNSEPFTPTVSGTYRWRASYSGDANNRPAGPSACADPAERVRVTVPAAPQLTTSASPAVTLGGAIRDTAHLGGGLDPRGTITFRLYGPGDDDCSARPVFTSRVPVAGNGDYASAPFTPATAGAYRWVARYSGDARNRPAGPTACDDPAETVIVRPPTVTPVVPTLTTAAAQHPAGGATLSDTALIAGGVSPTGALTFALFGPDDPACAGTPVFVTTVPVQGNGDYPSASFAAPGPGTYRWVVTYSGDALNAAVGPTACGEPTETSTVSAAPIPLPNPGPNVPLPAPEGGRRPGADTQRPSRPRVTG